MQIIIDKWTELLENGCQIDVIYTDLEKAFDKIPHKRLISKLSSYCINKDIISSIKACGHDFRLNNVARMLPHVTIV